MATDVHGTGELVDLGASGRVYVEVEGESDPVALVAPGGPGVSHIHYHPWFSALTATHRVVYLDYPGTGRSDRLPAASYTIETYARALAGVLDHLGRPKAAVIGLSFGGIPALELARHRPELVDRLVLSNAQVDAETWQRGNIDNVNRELREQHPELWAEVEQLRGEGRTSLDDRYQELVGRAVEAMEWYEPERRPVLRRPEQPGERFELDVYRAFCGDDPEWTLGGSLARHHPGGELASLTMPTLVVTGRHDRVTPPWIAHELAHRLTSSRPLVETFERSGHRPWAEEPEAYFRLLRDFLA